MYSVQLHAFTTSIQGNNSTCQKFLRVHKYAVCKYACNNMLYAIMQWILCMLHYAVCKYTMNALHATLCSMQVYNKYPEYNTMQYTSIQWMLCMHHYAGGKYAMKAYMLHLVVYMQLYNICSSCYTMQYAIIQ